MRKNSLFEEFDTIVTKAWKQQIQIDLKRVKSGLELYPFVKNKPRKTLLEPIVA
ncbi:MAG: hypothetical protein HKP42_07290 [Maribacter sp.]|nr:hypothetical protein [Maribacter sp.]